jgi:hypothetical protein
MVWEGRYAAHGDSGLTDGTPLFFFHAASQAGRVIRLGGFCSGLLARVLAAA